MELPEKSPFLAPRGCRLTYKKIRVVGGFHWLGLARQWLGVARQWLSVARSGMLAWSEGCQESRQCCASVDGVRRMTIAWLGFLTRSKSFILTHTAILFFRPVSFAQPRLHFRVPCCGVVRLIAEDVKGGLAPQGQSAHLRVREEQNANQSCGVRPDPARCSRC